MKKFLTVLLSALLVAASLSLAAFAQTASEETPVIKGDYVQGEVIVCLDLSLIHISEPTRPY